jgi:hypothetical protein
MKLVRFLDASVRELVALIVDDVATFVAGAIALVVTYLLAHNRIADAQHWGGFALLGMVWVGLAISFTREFRAKTEVETGGDGSAAAERPGASPDR